MKPSLLVAVLFLCAVSFTACSPSAGKGPSPRRVSRAANLKKYVSKSKGWRSRALLRAKPVVSGPLVDGQTLRQFIPKQTDKRLSAYLAKQYEEARGERLTRQMLEQPRQAWLDQVAADYGPACAGQAVFVLEKATDDYWLAGTSIQKPEVLQRALQQADRQADQAFSELLVRCEDPVVALSQEQAALLKANLITAHQQVETRFEKLYGKKAMLELRPLFEPYLAGVDEALAVPARLSEQSARLDALGAQYRKEVTALQVRLNLALEEKLRHIQSPLEVN